MKQAEWIVVRRCASLMAFLSACSSSDVGGPDELVVPLTHGFVHSSAEIQSGAEVGAWMFKGRELVRESIADWRGSPEFEIGLLEPINVIWVDYVAADVAEARQNVASYLGDAGFMTEGWITWNGGLLHAHSDGYLAWYEGDFTAQWPATDAWVDNVYPAENNHGRVFPAFNAGTLADPVYYTLGAFSRESRWDGVSGHHFLSFAVAQMAVVGNVSVGANVFGWTYDRFDTNWGNVLLPAEFTVDHRGVAVLVFLGATGNYRGTGNAVNTGCADADGNGPFSGTVEIRLAQRGQGLTGTMTFSFTFNGIPLVGVDNIVGTIDGFQVSDTLSGGLAGTTSVGTFAGTLVGDVLLIDFINVDTSGDTCTTTGAVVATRS